MQWMALTAPRMEEMTQHSMLPTLKYSMKKILTVARDPAYPDTQAGGFNGHDCGTIQPGSVISQSYGSEESQMSAAYQIRQCNE